MDQICLCKFICKVRKRLEYVHLIIIIVKADFGMKNREKSTLFFEFRERFWIDNTFPRLIIITDVIDCIPRTQQVDLIHRSIIFLRKNKIKCYISMFCRNKCNNKLMAIVDDGCYFLHFLLLAISRYCPFQKKRQ